MTLDSFQVIALMASSLQSGYCNEESAIKAAVRMYNTCKNRIDYDGEYYLKPKDAPKEENSKEGMVTWGNEEKSEIKTAEEVVIENRKKRRESWDEDDYDY